MPGIGLAIREIAFEMFENVDKPKAILHSKTMAACEVFIVS